MREIKFRGRRTHDKQWVFGNLLIDERGNCHIVERDAVEEDGHHVRIDSDSPMFFDNDTIGQFTGLHDKNGVKVYEGDIVKGGSYFPLPDGDVKKCNIAGVVKYINYSFVVNGIENFRSVSCHLIGLHDCEVTGNIYERSE